MIDMLTANNGNFVLVSCCLPFLSKCINHRNSHLCSEILFQDVKHVKRRHQQSRLVLWVTSVRVLMLETVRGYEIISK